MSGGVLWANLHLLFWLSLFPFATGWMGEKHFTALPTALYGVVLLMAALAYFGLQYALIRADGSASMIKQAIGADRKGKLSLLLYVVGIGVSFEWPWLGQLLCVAVALMWLIPDQRIEQAINHSEST